MTSFKEYISSYWMTQIGPLNLSVANNPRRTNNEAEVSNRYLNRRARSAHPNVFTWAQITSEILDRTTTEIESIERGLPVRRDVKNAFADKNAQLRILQRKVEAQTLDPVMFLSKCSSLCKGYHLWMVRNVQSYEHEGTRQNDLTAAVREPSHALTQSQETPASPALTRARAARIRQRESRAGIARPPVTEPMPSQSQATISSEGICEICTIHPKKAALVPCGHANLCQTCADHFRTEKKCPTCRQEVTSVLVLFNQM